jgi:hypothetical protein
LSSDFPQDKRKPDRWRLVIDYEVFTHTGGVIYRYIYRWTGKPPAN